MAALREWARRCSLVLRAPAGGAVAGAAPEAASDVDAEAAYARGVRLQEQGSLAAAEGWYLRAATAGHAEAANSLGLLLEEREAPGDGGDDLVSCHRTPPRSRGWGGP